ncbi:Amino acid permease [compost metagenome]
MLVLFIIGFLACMLGIQASVSRVIWAFARDRTIPCSDFLRQLSGDDKLPTRAFLLTGGLSALLFMLSFTNIYPLLLAFSIAGFYLAFAFPLVGACISVIKGDWREGPFSLGILSIPTIFAATGWTLFETVNISWPRYPELPWYENWAVPIMIVFLALAGWVIYSKWASPSYTHSTLRAAVADNE